MYTVYCLYSPKYDKIYIGYTSNLGQRLISHNELGRKGWTRKYRPWVLIYREEYRSKAKARRRENQLKTGRGRRFVWQKVEEYKRR